MFFAVGFLLFLGGVALLVNGGFNLPNGKTVRARPAQQMGGVFVSYFPVLIAVRWVLHLFDGADVISPTIVFAILTLIYFIVGLVLFVRAVAPARPRVTKGSLAEPADSVTDASPTSTPAQKSPFDFS